MPKHRFNDRKKPKPKSVKSRKVLNEERQLSRFGKKQLKGRAGVAVEYVSRTRVVKQMQVSIRDFRRLCILKGVYPRDPPHKRRLDGRQTYYHHKDVAFLMREPILAKFRQTKTFLKKFARAVGRRELGGARALYEARPVYSLDRIVKERYPRFADALGDLDDALSAVHLFANFPAEDPVKPEHTALARRLAREWQYFVARTRSLRRAFLSIKGCYFQADVRGVLVTWLVPWQFSQALPGDVDYRVMLTFLELHSVVLEFALFKLYADIGLAYPPATRAELDDGGAHLGALEVSTAAAAAKAKEESAARVLAEAAKQVAGAPGARAAARTVRRRGAARGHCPRAGNRSTGPADGRTDRVARSRYGGLGAQLVAKLLQIVARHDFYGVA
jgi:pescadillo protein